MNVLGMINRSRMAHPGVLIEEALDHSKCIECGQCSSVCPVGAIVEHSEWRQVLDALENKQKVRLCVCGGVACVGLCRVGGGLFQGGEAGGGEAGVVAARGEGGQVARMGGLLVCGPAAAAGAG